jgi:hypothetical protein
MQGYFRGAWLLLLWLHTGKSWNDEKAKVVSGSQPKL